jgi:hypothetical protein
LGAGAGGKGGSMSIAALISDMVRAGVDPDIIGRTAAALAETQANAKLPDHVPNWKLNKRAREKEKSRKIPDAVRALVVDRDGLVCRYCRSEVEVPNLDHVIPFSRGGEHTVDNLVVACRACNTIKHARTPKEMGWSLS